MQEFIWQPMTRVGSDYEANILKCLSECAIFCGLGARGMLKVVFNPNDLNERLKSTKIDINKSNVWIIKSLKTVSKQAKVNNLNLRPTVKLDVNLNCKFVRNVKKCNHYLQLNRIGYECTFLA